MSNREEIESKVRDFLLPFYQDLSSESERVHFKNELLDISDEIEESFGGSFEKWKERWLELARAVKNF